MQGVIFEPLASSSKNVFISTVNFLVALCSGGNAAHDETSFIADSSCEAFFQNNKVIYKGKPLEIKAGVRYSLCMSKHGFTVQTWDKRIEGLRKNYKGVITVYELQNSNLLALCEDIKECIEKKLTYGILAAYYSSINHTVLGKVFRFFGIEKGKKECCSGVSTIQRIKAFPLFRDYVWEKQGIHKHTNSIVQQAKEKQFARRQTPEESNEILLKLGCKIIDIIVLR